MRRHFALVTDRARELRARRPWGAPPRCLNMFATAPNAGFGVKFELISPK